LSVLGLVTLHGVQMQHIDRMLQVPYVDITLFGSWRPVFYAPKNVMRKDHAILRIRAGIFISGHHPMNVAACVGYS
jgi:hypothetical protein